MDWSLIAALAQVAAAIAVFVSLFYLARQIHQSNHQARLDAYRQLMQSLNSWGRSIYESEELADLVLRGRKSRDALTETEWLRFQHFHSFLLNTLQLRHDQVRQLSHSGSHRARAEETLGDIIRGYLDHPGVLQFWRKVRGNYGEGLRKLVDSNTGDA